MPTAYLGASIAVLPLKRIDGAPLLFAIAPARSRPTSQALPTRTAEGARCGTPLSMAPEQIRGDALDGRADPFAWGVLAYELLGGRLP